MRGIILDRILNGRIVRNSNNLSVGIASSLSLLAMTRFFNTIHLIWVYGSFLPYLGIRLWKDASKTRKASIFDGEFTKA